MTDAQIVAIAITVIAILGGTLINNTRIGDVKEVLRAEMDAGFAKLDLSLELRFSSIDRKLDELLRVVASHDNRIRELEECGR